MPTHIDDISLLQEYIRGVVERAEHHARNVNRIIYPLVGVIIRFKNQDRALEVR